MNFNINSYVLKFQYNSLFTNHKMAKRTKRGIPPTTVTLPPMLKSRLLKWKSLKKIPAFPHQCPYCQKVCKSLSSLKKHLVLGGHAELIAATYKHPPYQVPSMIGVKGDPSKIWRAKEVHEFFANHQAEYKENMKNEEENRTTCAICLQRTLGKLSSKIVCCIHCKRQYHVKCSLNPRNPHSGTMKCSVCRRDWVLRIGIIQFVE